MKPFTSLTSYLASALSGDASLLDSGFTVILITFLWVLFGFSACYLLWPHLGVYGKSNSVNFVIFGTGAWLIYGASLLSHAISASFAHIMIKIGARICTFILLLLGIALIIIVTSGQLSWTVTLYDSLR
ncbi:MAG: hypothetical protein ACON4G_06775 [Candidatus Puniceispirillaceae bacterium]